MKARILLCATVSLLLLCSTARYSQSNISAPVITDVTLIPQGAYEQIILEYDDITDEEICRIYASNVSYWNEVDKIMCGD